MSAYIRPPESPATVPDSCQLPVRSFSNCAAAASFSSTAEEAVSSTEETVLSAAELAETGTELAVPLLQPTRREADRASTAAALRILFIKRIINFLHKIRISALVSTNRDTDFTGTGLSAQEPNRQNLSNRTHLPILRRRHAGCFPKCRRKLIRIFVPDPMGDFSNRAIGFE